jgi:hypothetical protein
MRSRWSPTTWTRIVLSSVVILVAVDLGRGYLRKLAAEAPPPAQPAKDTSRMRFSVGEQAPDFELPDHKGRRQRLSRLVKRDTVLWFICGCSYCQDLQSYQAKLQRQLGKDAPDVIAVSNASPATYNSYRRDVPLDQTILYDAKAGPVTTEYGGDPCPRTFHLDGKRTVRWISLSPSQMPRLEQLASNLATELGFVGLANREARDAHRPITPRFDRTRARLGATGVGPHTGPQITNIPPQDAIAPPYVVPGEAVTPR